MECHDDRKRRTRESNGRVARSREDDALHTRSAPRGETVEGGSVEGKKKRGGLGQKKKQRFETNLQWSKPNLFWFKGRI